MSSRPSTPAPVHVVATNNLDKFPDKIRKELQRFIAVQAYEKNKNKSMHETDQLQAFATSFHGNGADIVGQVWKFLHQKEEYYLDMVHREDVYKTGQSQSSNWPIVIRKTYNRSNSVLILGENGNVTSDILKQTTQNAPKRCSGRHVLDMAKEEAREAKKMVTQMSEAVKMGIVELNGGEYTYCSGKTEEDLDNFICWRMHNWKQIYGASGGDDKDLNNLNPTATEEDMSAMGAPKVTYIPKGWFLFKARGPMAPKENRYDLMNNGLSTEVNGSRKKTRQEEKTAKDNARGFEAGSDGGRGMSLGATIKDMAIIAQQKRKLDQLDHAADIARLTSAMNSKNARWKTTLDTVKMLHEIGQAEEAKKMAQELSKISTEVKGLERKLELLKNGTSTSVDTNAPVEMFLQRGSEAMGLKTPTAPKKAKVTDLTNDDDKTNKSDEDGVENLDEDVVENLTNDDDYSENGDNDNDEE